MYSAHVFRIFIASPSDVKAERDLAVRVIQEWNDLNSSDRNVVLLPLKWETHSAPEMDKRPQEIINRQVVEHCDLAIGVFWTKVGSPTTVADSGSIEEIEKATKAGKLVMLYFSKVKPDLDAIDVGQLQKVRDYQSRIKDQALYAEYRDMVEFRDNLSRQLDIQIKTLVASLGNKNPTAPRPTTDIEIHFANPETGEDIGTTLELKTLLITVPDFDQIPDYVQKTYALGTTTGLSGLLSGTTMTWPGWVGKDFYRQHVTWLLLRNILRPIRFWFKNSGGIGARDVFIDLAITSSATNLILIPSTSLPSTAPTPDAAWPLSGPTHFTSLAEILQRAANSFQSDLELRALQPQREVSLETPWFLGALSDATATIQARVYADTLPEPKQQTLTINFKVAEQEISVNELIESLPVFKDIRDKSAPRTEPTERS